jgi:hypothetical protein
LKIESHSIERALCDAAAIGILLSASGAATGCIDTTEVHTETILARQHLELPPRRSEAGGTIGIDQQWEHDQLVLVASREQKYVVDTVERQTVRKDTVRKVESWGPAIAEGCVSAVAIGLIVGAEIDKGRCTTPAWDTGCGLGDAFIQIGATAVLIPMSAALFLNLGRSADTHKVESRDVSVAPNTSRLSVEPISGAHIVLQWADGAQVSAVTDAKGLARLAIAPERSAPSSPPAALFLDGRHVRDIDVTRIGAKEPR